MNGLAKQKYTTYKKVFAWITISLKAARLNYTALTSYVTDSRNAKVVNWQTDRKTLNTYKDLCAKESMKSRDK